MFTITLKVSSGRDAVMHQRVIGSEAVLPGLIQLESVFWLVWLLLPLLLPWSRVVDAAPWSASITARMNGLRFAHARARTPGGVCARSPGWVGNMRPCVCVCVSQRFKRLRNKLESRVVCGLLVSRAASVFVGVCSQARFATVFPATHRCGWAGAAETGIQASARVA